jgi:hypothetical protein
MAGCALYPWQPYDSSSYDFVFLSLGAGVQSSVLFALSAMELHGVPKATHTIFADTMDEPKWVYEHLERLREWGKQYGMEIETVSAGRLSECDNTFLRIPAFTKVDGDASITRRQCTREYKIAPINKRVRELLGIAKSERSKGRCALSLQGISSDEMQRMKDPRDKFIDIEYPLVRLGWTRHKCLDWWANNMPFKTPKKSACVYCPFRSNSEWKDIKANDPDGWHFAVEYDARIRNSTQAGSKMPTYLHRQLVPLDQVDLERGDKTGDLFDGMLNECEGMCGL